LPRDYDRDLYMARMVACYLTAGGPNVGVDLSLSTGGPRRR